MFVHLQNNRVFALSLLMLLAASLAACTNSSSSSSRAGSGTANGFQCPAEGDGAYAISGSVAVAPEGILDSDTRAEIKPLVDNGSFASAQPIPNSAIIAGYANRNQANPDTNDFYVVELAAGDELRMLVGDAGYDCFSCNVFDDLDLFLYDSNQVLVAFSENSGIEESLVAPADGLYYIEVRVWEGESGYVLRVQPAGATGVAATNALDLQFVPGEVVMQRLPPEPGVLTAQAASLTDMEAVAGRPQQGMLMRMVPQVTASAVASDDDNSADRMQFRDAEQRLKYQTLRRIKQLRADPTVKHVSPNYIFEPTRIPNDEYFYLQWHYHNSDRELVLSDATSLPAAPGAINLPDAWEYTQGDPSVVVAVIDSGVRINHPDLKDKLVDGYDFVRDPFAANDGDGLDPDPTDPGNPRDPGGFNTIFHGTHVAGTVAADTNNGIGVAGVAWGASIMPLRALGQTSGTFYDIMQAMRYAAGLENDSRTILPPERIADIINLSLGGFLSAPDVFLQSVVDEVRAQGVIIVAAAGNRASSLAFYPASFRGVISVSAVGRDAAITSYSNFGPNVDAAAPGGTGAYPVWSTSGPYDYAQFSYAGLRGTSMASPHVAGVIALMQSARITAGMEKLTPEQVDFLLAQGALTRDLGSVGRDDLYGYGLIDAAKAVEAAISNVSPLPTPILSVTPAAVDFQSELDVALLTVRNVGGGSMNVSVNKTGAADWLAISGPVDSDGNPVTSGEGVYTLRVSRNDSELAAGTYTTELLIQSSDPQLPDLQQVAVPVSLTVLAGDAPALGEITELTVALVDPAFPYVFMQNVPPQIVTPMQPDFQFENLPVGCYLVVASSDIDGDRIPADIGEKWGAWVAPGETTNGSVVILDADIGNVDFSASFD